MFCYVYIILLFSINLASSTPKCVDFVDHNRQYPLVCTCEDPSLCQPIPRAKGKTRLAYSKVPENWKYYDFTKITELILSFATADIDPELVCMAHKNNVQLHLKGCFTNETYLNPVKQDEWIDDNLKKLTDNYLDGINIDFEQPRNAEHEPLLVSFMVKLSKKLRSMNSNYQLTYCLETFPKPNNDYTTIPEVMDYLMIMDYDQANINEQEHCYASANEHPLTTITGLTEYLELGIPPSKIVIGMPWYGLLATCEKITSSGRCIVKNCSHDSRMEMTIPKVYELYDVNGNYKLTQGWDDAKVSPFLTIIPKVDNLDPIQFWYDNSISLTRKAEMYKPFQIRGIGVFHADCLNYTMPVMKSMNKDFWNLFTVFQD
ncbi:Di-N-acetylchitobiase precursor [Oopsacas minuta]|uniref:Di-N-acetylchitobiase n=1 Tax=Oopsacas minuta TaxID=111878 RepID=A0AAV7KDQ0_9METZ|nr:Di-N-acetylchitobiase precursor [Oopsacas minuta]